MQLNILCAQVNPHVQVKALCCAPYLMRNVECEISYEGMNEYGQTSLLFWSLDNGHLNR